MSKKRLILIGAALLVLLASLAVSSPFFRSPNSSDFSWPPRPDMVSVTSAEPNDVSVESIAPASQNSHLDECFDVSLSELTSCRAASQLPSP